MMCPNCTGMFDGLGAGLGDAPVGFNQEKFGNVGVPGMDTFKGTPHNAPPTVEPEKAYDFASLFAFTEKAMGKKLTPAEQFQLIQQQTQQGFKQIGASPLPKGGLPMPITLGQKYQMGAGASLAPILTKLQLTGMLFPKICVRAMTK